MLHWRSTWISKLINGLKVCRQVDRKYFCLLKSSKQPLPRVKCRQIFPERHLMIFSFSLPPQKQRKLSDDANRRMQVDKTHMMSQVQIREREHIKNHINYCALKTGPPYPKDVSSLFAMPKKKVCDGSIPAWGGGMPAHFGNSEWKFDPPTLFLSLPNHPCGNEEA